MRPEIAADRLLSMRVVRSAMSVGIAREVADEAVRAIHELGIVESTVTKRSAIFAADRLLRTKWRNHHVYRAAVLSAFPPGIGRVVIPEFRVGDSIADVVIVDQTAHVVEIKSDLDDLGRLEGQVGAYRSVAPLISVAAQLTVLARISSNPYFDDLGLYQLSNRLGLVEVRKPTYRDDGLRGDRMVSSLRRDEFSQALSRFGVDLANLPNTAVFGSALRAVERIEPRDFNEAYVAALRRRSPRVGLACLKSLPRPILASVLRLDPSRTALLRLESWLQEGVRDVSTTSSG